MHVPRQDTANIDDLLRLQASIDRQPTIPPTQRPHRPRLNLKRRKKGNVVYMARVTHGYTQQQLAALVGVSVRTINEIESRRSSPSVHTAIAIAQTLEVPVETIFTLRDPWFGRRFAPKSHQ